MLFCKVNKSAWLLGGLLLAQAQAGALSLPDAAGIARQCAAVLSTAQQAQDALVKGKPADFLAGFNRQMLALNALSGPVALLSETSPDPALRRGAEDCLIRLGAFSNRMYQSQALYRAAQAFPAGNPIDRRARTQLLASFEALGVDKPAAQRQRIRALADEIDRLGQHFSRNLRDKPRGVAFTPAELAGVPERFLAAQARDSAGAYLIGLDAPQADAILRYADKESTRQRYWAAYNLRGGAENIRLLARISRLRSEMAGQLGYPSYADYALKQRMAGSPGRVRDFLGKVGAVVSRAERQELAELTALKREQGGDAQARLARWDVSYYLNRLQNQRYALDQNEVRRQFPTQPTLDWLMNVSSQLYGLRFQPNTQLPRWQPDVQAFDVLDSQSGALLGSFYLDLFPRDGKYKHAAAFPVREGSTQEGVTPVSALVTNFDRSGFDQDELETLFHEFGHVLHGVLSQTRYAFQSGTNVKLDFVEAPSQMFEAWSRSPAALALYTQTCSGCQAPDPALLARMNAARRSGLGIQYARQHLYASYDLALAGAGKHQPLALWQKMEAATPLGHVPGSLFPASFGHIAGGYAAGYYSYMWSQVMALDMESRFGDALMDPAIGRRYRDIILARGDELAPDELVTSFLQRPVSNDAFFREISGPLASPIQQGQ